MSFGEESHIVFGDKLNVIVGPNDSGKTSVFRAISFLSDMFGNRSRGTDFEVFSAPYYHKGSRDPIELSVEVEFDDVERKALSDFLVSSCLLIISQHEEGVREVEKELILHKGHRVFGDLFKETTIMIKVQHRQLYPVIAYLRIKGPDKRELFVHSLGIISSNPSKPTRYSPTSLVDMVLADAGLSTAAIKEKPAEEIAKAVVGYEPTNLFDIISTALSTPEGSDTIRAVDIQGFNFADIESRIEHFLKIDSLDQGHDLVRFMRNAGHVGAGANLFEVIQAIYDDAIVRTSNSRCVPRQVILGRKTEKGVDSHEVTTDDLPEILFNLKNSIKPEERDAYRRISNEFSRINNNAEFEVVLQERVTETETQEFTTFNPSAGLNAISSFGDINGIGIRSKRTPDVHHEMVIIFTKNGIVIPVHMAAAGMFETLYVLTVVIAPIKKIILLDEPALNLHPNMQRKIIDTLLNYSIKKNNNQVVLVTHSPSMLDIDSLDTIHRLSADRNGSTDVKDVREVVRSLDDSDEKQLTQWLRSVDMRSLLFSRGVVLVEGPSDKVVIDSLDGYLSEKGKGASMQDREIAVISVGGKKSMRILLTLAKELGMNYLVLVDSDALINCEGRITLDGRKVRTSPILQALYESEILTKEHAELIGKLEKDGIVMNPSSEIYEYKDDGQVRQTLKSIVEKYNLLVFEKNLEEALQIKESRRRKPALSADAIFEKIENGQIPEELGKIISELKNKTMRW